MDVDRRFLAWFLGPKAEHSELLERSLLLVMRYYVHWRRNYFPGDRPLITQSLQKELSAEYDVLSERLLEMTAELRRNFPFYSPRYVAHQLSDVTLPWTLGYVAALFYNANNVTPEAAPVTVDWEIEACSQVLSLLGYTPPPEPPTDRAGLPEYERRLRQEFGWAHLTHGGTSANIEALWVARAVRYFPMAAQHVAKEHRLDLAVTLPGGGGPGQAARSKRVAALRREDLLVLRPNDSIYLMGSYVQSVADRFHLDLPSATAKAAALLQQAPLSLWNGFGNLFSKYPPVIFVSGTAHYGLLKAADVLGIGRANVEQVAMTSSFRMDVADLERKIRAAVNAGRFPLAVVGIAGTTEEGAVDPIHAIKDLRRELQDARVSSFWLHIDAAWGGFIRALFRDSDAILDQVSTELGIDYLATSNMEDWHRAAMAAVRSLTGDRSTPSAPAADSGSTEAGARKVGDTTESIRSSPPSKVSSVQAELDRFENELREALRIGDFDGYARQFQKSLNRGEFGIPRMKIEVSLSDRGDLAQRYVRDDMRLGWSKYQRRIDITWGYRDLSSAFVAFPDADSITVDPHKMGYAGYPSGVVAFRNDRVRHFILERAPYITSQSHSALLHQPPKHIKDAGEYLRDPTRPPTVQIDAFGPFILEGSRPGAAAGGLWLALRTIPADLKNHGAIVRSSLLAARELYEWLRHWTRISEGEGIDSDYEFITLVDLPPDTNIVTFVVRLKSRTSLRSMNRLTSLVYDRLSIQAELGDRQYSYAQPFFISKTTCERGAYPFDTMAPFLKRAGVRDAGVAYAGAGVVVLRATVMNPYIHSLRANGIQDVIRELVGDLGRAAQASSAVVQAEGK